MTNKKIWSISVVNRDETEKKKKTHSGLMMIHEMQWQNTIKVLPAVIWESNV